MNEENQIEILETENQNQNTTSISDNNSQIDLPISTITPQTNGNENTTQQTVIVQGQEMTFEQATYMELLKTNFYLLLILTVTVVFFVINKFWSWLRRLFTVNLN